MNNNVTQIVDPLEFVRSCEEAQAEVDAGRYVYLEDLARFVEADLGKPDEPYTVWTHRED